MPIFPERMNKNKRDFSITFSNSNMGKEDTLTETRTADHVIEDDDNSKASEKSNDLMHSNPLFKIETIHQDIESNSHISPLLKNCESTSTLNNENIDMIEKYNIEALIDDEADSDLNNRSGSDESDLYINDELLPEIEEVRDEQDLLINDVVPPEIGDEINEQDLYINDEVPHEIEDEINEQDLSINDEVLPEIWDEIDEQDLLINDVVPPEIWDEIDEKDLFINDDVPPEIEKVIDVVSISPDYEVIMKANNPIFMNQDVAFNDSEPSIITVNDPNIGSGNNYKHGTEKVLTDNMEVMKQSNGALGSYNCSNEVSSDEEDIDESSWPFWKSIASSLNSFQGDELKLLKKPKNTLPSYSWRELPEQITTGMHLVFYRDSDYSENQETPYNYFCRFFDEKIMIDILQSTNYLYYMKNCQTNLHLSKDELKQWLGIAIAMSLFKFDDSRLYWLDNYFPNIRKTMSHKRWETIKKHLQYATQSSQCDGSDKVGNAKILSSNLGSNFRKNHPVKEHLYIREKIVYCRTEKSFISNHKIGYRLLVLQDIEGMIHDFIIYMNENSQQLYKRNPVLDFSQVIPKSKNHKLHSDERFTSVQIIDYLATKDIYVCGPILPNDRTWRFRNNSDQVSSNRSYEVFETRNNHNSIVAFKCRWNDESKWFASSFSLPEQAYPVSKSDRNIEIPNIVKVYKEHQNILDRNEQTIEKYRMSVRANKYCTHLLFYLLDMAVVNSWLLFKRSRRNKKQHSSTEYSLCEFKMELSKALMKLKLECRKEKTS